MTSSSQNPREEPRKLKKGNEQHSLFGMGILISAMIFAYHITRKNWLGNKELLGGGLGDWS